MVLTLVMVIFKLLLMGESKMTETQRLINQIRKTMRREEIAVKLGVSANTVYRWETGERNCHPLRIGQLKDLLKEVSKK
jgi:transcriptional regulator with XRE-family HTH domain